MKTIYALFLLSLSLPSLGSLPDLTNYFTYRDQVIKNLRFLDDSKFPSKPDVGLPWVSVSTNNRKAILLCPVGGIGDAILIFSDGFLKHRKATIKDHVLSYETTIKSQNGNDWAKLDLGTGWKKLNLNSECLKIGWDRQKIENANLSEKLGSFFSYQFGKAAHTKIERPSIKMEVQYLND